MYDHDNIFYTLAHSLEEDQCLVSDIRFDIVEHQESPTSNITEDTAIIALTSIPQEEVCSDDYYEILRGICDANEIGNHFSLPELAVLADNNDSISKKEVEQADDSDRVVESNVLDNNLLLLQNNHNPIVLGLQSNSAIVDKENNATNNVLCADIQDIELLQNDVTAINITQDTSLATPSIIFHKIVYFDLDHTHDDNKCVIHKEDLWKDTSYDDILVKSQEVKELRAYARLIPNTQGIRWFSANVVRDTVDAVRTYLGYQNSDPYSYDTRITTHDRRGGHTQARHIARPYEYLQVRHDDAVLAVQTGLIRDVPDMTSFYNMDQAQTYVNDVISRNFNSINTWARDAKNGDKRESFSRRL